MSKARAERAGGMFDRPVQLLSGTFVVVVLLWAGFTAGFKLQEMLVGLVASALTVAFFANVLRTETLNLELHTRDLLQLRKIPWAIVARCWQITVLLFKDLAGRPVGSFYRECGFKTSRHNPTLIGRTALAVAYTTVAPNFIVIGVDPAQSLMLFHQIERSEVSEMTRALGAQQ